MCRSSDARRPIARRAAPGGEASPSLELQRLGKLAQLGLEAPAIERVADQGMADMGEMHAHLMGASGLERAFEQGGDRSLAPFAASERREHAPMGHGLASLAGGQHRHLGAARRVAADRRIDGAMRRGGAPQTRAR